MHAGPDERHGGGGHEVVEEPDEGDGARLALLREPGAAVPGEGILGF